MRPRAKHPPDRSAILADLGQRALLARATHELTKQTVEIIGATLDAPLVKMMRIEPERETLVLESAIGWPKDAIGKAEVPLAADTQGAYTLRKGEPVRVDDYSTERRFSSAGAPAELSVQSGISVVVEGRERPYGILCAQSPRPGAFRDADTRFLHAAANIVGAAIERENAHLALKQSEERMQAVMDGVVDGVVTIDQGGIIRSFNRAACRMFGVEAGEIIGQSVAELMPRAQQAKHQGYIDTYLKTGAARVIGIGREVEAMRRDGSSFQIELSVSEVSIAKQHLFTGIIRDITARKEVERALHESEKRYRRLQLHHTTLERAAVAGELAGIMAHEVRTPLNALAINAQMIKRALGKQDGYARAEQLVDTLRGEIDRINGLLEVYLNVLRRPTSPGKHSFSLYQATADAIRFVEATAATHRVRIAQKLPSDLPRVRGEEDRMRQVLLNLLLNGLEAMPDGGELLISADAGDTGVILEVRDTGPGISEDVQQRIFQPFVTTKPKGTGLGLAISERLVKDMGGSIRVTSKPGEGACFEVLLQAA